MRMKRLLFVLMAIIMVFTFGVLGCTPAISGGGNDPDPAPPGPVTPPGGGDEDPENPIVKVPWIKISNTELTLDQYDEYQLTTTTGNTEKAVVWSSSNSTVVSVDQTGYIIAKNPGNAIITAKAGTDASDPIATCQVRVLNNPGAMATLEIHPDVISVGKNGQYTLAVKPMFNGKEITDSATLDAIEYDWKLSGSETALANDFVSAQVSATNKNEITFTGLDYGSATYYVSALIRGANIMETVVVTCNNADYNFKIEGGDIKSGSGAFVATVAGIGATLTPVVKAYTKEGTEVGAVAATWVSDNAEVATVSGEVITATGFGTVTLVGTFADNAYKGVAVAIKLTVTRPEGQLTEAFTFETGKTTFRAPSGLGEITDIFYGGVSYFVSAEGRNVVLKDDIKKLTHTDIMDETKQLVIQTTEQNYIAQNAKIVTLEINDAAELDMFWDAALSTNYGENAYGGYFVLGNNIAYNKTWASKWFWGDLNSGTSELQTKYGKTSTVGNAWEKPGAGFTGVFDGQGYMIDGITIGNVSGLFGGVSQYGTIKNIGFTNVTVNGTINAVISQHSFGTMENLYVGVKALGYVESGNNKSGVLVSNSGYGVARVINCFVDVHAKGSGFPATVTTWDATNVLGRFHEGYGSLQNVYAVTQGINLWTNMNTSSIGTDATNVATGFNTRAAMASNTAWKTVYNNNWSKDYWTLDKQGLPIMKGMDIGVIGLSQSVAAPGALVTLRIAGAANGLVSSWSATGLTVTDGKVTIPAGAAQGTTYTVTANTTYYGSYSFTLTVGEGQAFIGEDRVLGVYGKNSLDLTLDPGMAGVTVQSVSIGGVDVTDYETGNCVITLGKSAFENLDAIDGYQEVVIVANKGGATYTETFNARFVTMTISTADDLDNWQDAAKAKGTATSWAGTFVLVNDVVYNEDVFATNARMFSEPHETDVNDTPTDARQGYGFNGLFDGQGYAIDGLYVGTPATGKNSFIGPVASSGIVQNISFINARMGNGAGLISTNTTAGTIKNIYAHVAASATSGDVISGGNFGVSTMENIVVEFDGTTGKKSLLNWGNTGYGLKNVYVIGEGAVIYNGKNTSHGADVGTGEYATWAAFNTAAPITDTSVWTNDFWMMVGNYPVPKKLASAGRTLDFGNSATDAVSGVDYKFTVKNDYYTTLANDKGYAMVNGVVTAPTQSFTITGTSLITGASNGSFAVTLFAGQEVKLANPVKAYINDDTDKAITVDFTNEIASVVGAGQTAVLRAGSAKFSGIETTEYTAEGFVFTLQEDKFKDENAKTINSGKHVFEFVVDIKEGGEVVKIINCSADIILVTKVIKTADDFMAMRENYMLNDYKSSGKTSGVDLRVTGGYYELGNDIVLNRDLYNFQNWFSTVGEGWQTSGGFQGTFDGCGYSVDGIVLKGITGIFGGTIGGPGVIKNVAFTNVTMGNSSSVLTQNLFGTVENVYVHAKTMGAGSAINGTGAIAYYLRGNDFKINNVVVDIDALTYTVGSLGNASRAGEYDDNFTNAVGRVEVNDAALASRITNVLAITQGEAVYNLGDHMVSATNGDVMTATAQNVYGFNTRADAIAGKASLANMIAGLDTSIWTTDANGLPVFKSIKDIPADAELANTYAIYGLPSTLALKGSNATVGTWSTTASGVTISGNQITINAGAPSSVTVTLTSRFGGTKNFTINVTASKTFDLGTVKTELADSNEYAVFDFNSQLDSELTAGQTMEIIAGSLKYGTTAITDYTYEDGVLKIRENVFKASNGKQLSGKTAISFTANVVEGGSTVGMVEGKADLTIITKILRTEADVLGWYNLAKQDWSAESVAVWAGSPMAATTEMRNAKYGGYFELGNNIHMTGQYPTVYSWFEGVQASRNNGVDYWGVDGGFQGTFDGCGYTIDNLCVSAMQGFFGGVVGQNAVIKNIAFTNVSSVAGQPNVLGQNLCGGKVENVYIHLKQLNKGGQPNGASAAFFSVQSNATMNNIVVKVDLLGYVADSLTGTELSYTNVLGKVAVGSTITNAIAVTAGEAVYYDESIAGPGADVASATAEVMIKGSVYGYDTYAQAITNKTAYASVTNILTATGLWATNNDGFPVLKSLQYPDSTTLTAQNVVIGGSLDLAISDSFYAGITSSWSSATSGATVRGNVVTVDPAMPEDSTITVTATNQYGFSKSFSLTAIKATQVTGTAQKLHKVKATQTIAIEAEGTCESILIAGVPVETFEFISGEGVTFTKEAIANVPNGKGTMLVLTKNGDEYTETSIALDVASMVITTKEELLEFASLPRETTWGVGELYVIDADIDMEGAEYGINVNTNGANNVTGTGFAGTFDGRGHVIKNITMVGNGFISGIRRDGVLKNVAFLNATQKSQGFLSATTQGPTVENIYAQITSEYNGNAGFLGGDNYAGKCFSNIVVDVTGKVGNYYLLFGHYNRNYGTLKDVYMIGATGITAGTTSTPSSSVDNVQIFANYSAFVAGGNDTEGNAIVYTDMDNDFWNIVGGVPVPASVVTNVAPVIANTEVSNLAVKPITLEIQDNIPFVTVSLSSAVDGVSVLGRKVNVTSAAAGKSFTVVVTNPVTNASASKTFSIRSVNEVTLTNRIDMDLGAGDTVTVDMSEVFTQYGITDPATEIESATVAGQDAMFTVDGNNLVFQSSMLKMESTLGEKDLRLSVTTTGGDMYDLLQPVTVISKIIMNKEDALNMINYAITPNEGGDTKMGYFVLGADVDAEGSPIGIGYYDSSAVNTVYRSTFDGRGHTLSNVVYAQNASGIFGMSNGCTFKNLIMRNVTVNHSGASPLTESAGGTTTVTNVFIEGNLNGGTPADWGEQSLAIGKAGGAGAVINMTNVYTVVTSANYTDTTFAGTHFGERGVFGSFTNCVGLNLTSNSFRLAYDGNTLTNAQVVTTKVAAAALTGHSGTAWDAFKAYCQA